MSLLHRFPQIAPSLALALALGLFARGTLADDSRQAAPAEAPAPAQTATPVASVNMEVIILHATNDGTGIDPKIGKIPELSKPPFSSYNSYKLLDRPKIAVAQGAQSTVKLPNGRDMAVKLNNILAPVKKGEVTRYDVSTIIQNPRGNTFLPLLQVTAKAGEWFFVAGQTYKGGVLVIGIKVLP